MSSNFPRKECIHLRRSPIYYLSYNLVQNLGKKSLILTTLCRSIFIAFLKCRPRFHQWCKSIPLAVVGLGRDIRRYPRKLNYSIVWSHIFYRAMTLYINSCSQSNAHKALAFWFKLRILWCNNWKHCIFRNFINFSNKNHLLCLVLDNVCKL